MTQVYRNVAGVSISCRAVQQSFATKCIPGGAGIHNVGRALWFGLTDLNRRSLASKQQKKTYRFEMGAPFNSLAI